MVLSRRQFLTLMGGSAAAAVLFQACGVPEDELLVQSPVEMPEDLVSGLDNWYATLCRQCPTSEGLVVRVMEGRAKKIEGNVDYPINRGKHSARCEASLQALYHPDRIKGPLIRVGERGSGQFEEISWTDAIGRLTFQLQNLQNTGQQSSMVMITEPLSAHLGMVVERFTSRFGGKHIPYEPLEQTNLRTAIKQVFAQDVMPDFDIENASYVLSFGADFLNTWTSPIRYARGYGHFRQGNRERGSLIHIDSRFSMTGANADQWMHVNPGMEGILALSMAQVIISEGLGEPGASEALTEGDSNRLESFAPELVSHKLSNAIPPDKMAQSIRQVAIDFATHRPALAMGGGSTAAHTNGLFNLVAIYSLNHLVGNVGQPGGVIFNPSHPLPDLPTSPATSNFTELQELIAQMHKGQIQVMMVHGADPWHGLPDGMMKEQNLKGFKDAIFDVPFIFSFSGFMNDTAAMSDLILPEHNHLEDWGSDIPNPGPGYQVVGFQQPVVRPFFESRGVHLGTKNFADALLTIGQRLNLDLGLSGDTFKAILQDGARQLFDMNRGSVRAGDFKSFWNGVLQRGGWWDTSVSETTRIPTPPPLPQAQEPTFSTQELSGSMFHLVPFVSTSIGDGKGAALPWLQATPDPISTATWETWVEINLKKANEMDIKEGDVIKITSPQGSIEALAFPHPAMPPDVVSIPIGQGHSAGGRFAKGRGSNVLSILSPSTDKATGALAWAATQVNIEKTGRWVRLPKFENTVPELPTDEEGHIVPISTHDT